MVFVLSYVGVVVVGGGGCVVLITLVGVLLLWQSWAAGQRLGVVLGYRLSGYLDTSQGVQEEALGILGTHMRGYFWVQAV